MKTSDRLLIALLICMIGLCPAAMASSLDAAMPAEDGAAELAVAADTAPEDTSGTADRVKEPAVRWAFGVSLTALQEPCLLLVNEEHPLDKNYEPASLVKMTGVKRATSAAIYLEENTAKALEEMFQAALEVRSYTYTGLNQKGEAVEITADYPNGMTLYLKSGYRAYGTQSTTYANYLARNNNVDDGYVAKPGASEHQSGMCCDILDAEWASRDRMTQDFKNTAVAHWLKDNCTSFGFILRFPEDQEEKTGIKFEPWHFRYVGKEVAGYLTSTGITLEDFTESWQDYMEKYLERGGNVDEQLLYEDSRINVPPESFILDEYGADGDAEVSLLF